MNRIIHSHFKIATILIISILLSRCTKDFIVKDIKKETLSIYSPIDNFKTPNNTITFWWEELDGAETYNLQIVSPNFNSVSSLVLDTVISTNKFNKTLIPGIYQWRLKATNTSGSTAYVTRNLIIDTTSNLGLVSVNLISPSVNFVTQSNNILLSWNSLASASYYELKYVNLTTNSITTISNIYSTSYPITLNTLSGSEDKYSWQVKAYNAFSQTFTNIVRTFKIDLKAPMAPSILTPTVYGYNLRDTFRLKYSRSSFSSDVKYDILTLGSDSLFSSPITQTISTVAPVQINSILTYSGSLTPYWWKITSVDSVGNISNQSLSKRFYIY
jgi:hypothetical protein